jgi:tRNA-specific 2-thiouridylase
MAAYFLKQQGKNVVGLHFITGFEADASDTPDLNTFDKRDIFKIGMQLDIPVKVVDIHKEFQEKVIDYFTDTYQRGQTPNPCMQCNPNIKFGTLLSYALELGASTLATGHYARIQRDKAGNYHLFKALDSQKDQSYFLARLTSQQLASALFPLGEMIKSDVKKLAKQNGLRPITTGESQDVCFTKNGSYGAFLARQKHFEAKPGPIEDTKGRVIGKHSGLHLFTVGQRRGINCPAADPYYVVQLDVKRNSLIIGSKEDLMSSECKVKNINWIGQEPSKPLEIHTRVRYRSKEVASFVIPQKDQTALVRFKRPQMAITPGQGAVFYRGNEILGGGWIEESLR